MTPDEAAHVWMRLPKAVNGDAALVRRGRFFSAPFMVQADETPFHLTVEHGRLVAVEQGPLLLRPWRFAIRATAEAWARFWEPVPAPGYHDLFAMTRFGAARIEGDLQPLMANLRYVKEVIEKPRQFGQEG